MNKTSAAVINSYFLVWLLTLSDVNAVIGICQKAGYNYSWSVLSGMATNYDTVRGYGNLSVKGCTPHKIWSYARHGIKQINTVAIRRSKLYLPDLKDNILESNKNGNGTLCKEDVHQFMRWRTDNLTKLEANFLTSHGKQQTYDLGERLKNHFPNLLERNYDPNLFYFGHSNWHRSLATLRGFVEGIFSNDNNFVSAYIGEFDKIANYDCLLDIIAPFENNFEGLPAVYNFSKKTNLFETVAKNLSHRTGLPSQRFDNSMIILLYDTCIFETARDNRLSPWCSIFAEEDAQLMFFRQRLFYYTSFSKGSEHRDKLACIQMKSMLSFFNDAVENATSGYLMKAYFGHDALLQEIMTKMNCFKTELADGYLSSNSDFNVSNITPFGANLVAVLYKCEDTEEVHKLQFYLNEKPLGCCLAEGGKEACSWTEFRNKLSDFVLNCDEDFCDVIHAKNSAATFFCKLIFLICNILFFLFYLIV